MWETNSESGLVLQQIRLKIMLALQENQTYYYSWVCQLLFFPMRTWSEAIWQSMSLLKATLPFSTTSCCIHVLTGKFLEVPGCPLTVCNSKLDKMDIWSESAEILLSYVISAVCHGLGVPTSVMVPQRIKACFLCCPTFCNLLKMQVWWYQGMLGKPKVVPSIPEWECRSQHTF